MSAYFLKSANEFSVIFLGTSRSDDSTGDRLNYRYTCAILVAFYHPCFQSRIHYETNSMLGKEKSLK